MPIRQTSAAAYYAVLNSGQIGKRQKQVYQILYDFGPLTANQAFNKLAEQLGSLRFDSNTRARFTELRELGVICERGTIDDPITHRNVILWDVTANLPQFTTQAQEKRIVDRIKKLASKLKNLRRRENATPMLSLR